MHTQDTSYPKTKLLHSHQKDEHILNKNESLFSSSSSPLSFFSSSAAVAVVVVLVNSGGGGADDILYQLY